jgi:uroporphyrinogen decarboxylase
MQTNPLSEPAAKLQRFHERLDTAIERCPPSKQWVRNALQHRGAPRCPVRFKRLSFDIILRHGDALADLFAEFPDDVVFAQPYEAFLGYRTREPIDVVAALTQDAEWTDEWGTTWGHLAGGVGASPRSCPLADWSQLDQYLAHKLPDPRAPGRLDGALPALQRHGSARYFTGMTHLALFERFHMLRGMENTFQDFYVFPKETDRLLEALTEYYLEIIRSWGRLDNIDSIFLTDDWGTQHAMMISPTMWRKFFATRYRRICDQAHRSGLAVMFHSCGHVTEIIGDLIDAGIDVLDPLQPESMDLQAVAREFGGKVAFSGGLSDQRLALLSPTQIKDEVRRTIDTLGTPHGNAYLIAPSNVLTPEIPLANLRALFEAAHSR